MSSRVIALGLLALLCLTVAPAFAAGLMYNFPLDSDPGWTQGTEWDFGSGANCGGGGGCGAPGAYTGSNVFAIALGTSYPSDMGTQYLTTGALDCSSMDQVHLTFWRWIGMAGNTYAAVWVSTDGTNWTDVWAHTTADAYENYADGEWTECVYDISSVAANHSTVYVRWVMTRNPGAVCSGTCWGWTLDDIQLWDGVPAVPHGENVLYSFPMDTNPGWTTEGDWAFGQPAGAGGDPSSGYDGSYVYGYNLNGQYPNSLPQYALTTTALDFTGMIDTKLRFLRWLGVENSTWDHVYVQVSNDGSGWTTLWSNDGLGSFQESSWVQVEYDISAVADNQPTVYLRWIMGTTDTSITYSGWNIDNVELLGVGGTQVLAWIPYADTSWEYPQTLAALSSEYPQASVTSTTTLDSFTLSQELVGKHVFLMPEPEYASDEDLEAAGEAFQWVLRQFVQSGGTVISLGESLWFEGFLDAAGLMQVTPIGGYTGNDMAIIAPDHPLVDGVTGPIPAQDATYTSEVGPEATVVVEGPDGNAVVAARQMGAGAVVLLGYDFWDYDSNAARILANAVQYPRASSSVILHESYTGSYRVGLEALTRLNYIPALTDDSTLNTTLASGFWNAVVSDAPGLYPSGGWQPFIDWVNAGGHGVVSTWDLDGNQATLCAALGASAGTDLPTVPAVYDWDGGPPLFDYRESVPSPIATWEDRAGVDANQLTVTADDAMALAGFTEDQTTGEAAVVMGNDARTLLNGFLWYDHNQDADADEVEDCVELVMNEIAMALCVPIPDFGVDATECVVGDTLYFDDDSDANRTTWLWNFGDSNTSALQDPSHSYAAPGIYDVWMRVGNRNGFDTAVEEDYLWVGFPDAPPDFWAFHEILNCVDAGVVQGYSPTVYAPDNTVTRDQMAVYIARALAGGDASVPAGPGTATFNDVPTDYWAFKYVEYCVANGIVQGYDPVTYLPENIVNRAQMAVFIARAIAGGDGSVPAGPGTATFNDVPTDYWAFRHVEYCKAQGVVQGYDPVTYLPENEVNRGQMAVFVSRALPLL